MFIQALDFHIYQQLLPLDYQSIRITPSVRSPHLPRYLPLFLESFFQLSTKSCLIPVLGIYNSKKLNINHQLDRSIWEKIRPCLWNLKTDRGYKPLDAIFIMFGLMMMQTRKCKFLLLTENSKMRNKTKCALNAQNQDEEQRLYADESIPILLLYYGTAGELVGFLPLQVKPVHQVQTASSEAKSKPVIILISQTADRTSLQVRSCTKVTPV